MKRKLALLLAVVLCLSVTVLAACGEQNQPAREPGADADSSATLSADVPTEEGKVTYVIALSEDTTPQGDFVSIYMTGAAFGWATGLDALQLVNLEGTNLYYGISEAIPDPDSADEQKFDYQVLLGYNANSGLPESEQGLQWGNSAYKSDVCDPEGGEANPKFVFNAGDQVVNLGEDKFSQALPEPKQGSVTLQVSFVEALPEGARVFIFGEVNNWGYTETSSEFSSEDGIVWQLPLEDILFKAYNYKLKVFAPDEFNPDNVWEGGVEYSNNGDNLMFTFLEIDNGMELDLFAEPQAYAPATGIDVTLQIEFEEALPEGYEVYIFGGMNGWAYSDDKCQFTSEDGKVWTLALTNVNAEAIEFKLRVFAAGTFDSADVWSGGTSYVLGGVIQTDGGDPNAVVTLTEADDGTTVSLFEQAIPVPGE